ncbi:hypothetical protein [Belnapia moabensis]|uniref:hypothetical protein n=1 Tax=Belnapia moabensis TaxID=365533 RepID=UPI0005B9F7B0|nr:hypothetical protein [Belnapia moabensis]
MSDEDAYSEARFAMVELQELAFQITCALRAEEPEPLPVKLWHQSPDSAAHLVRAVIEECRDADVKLERVRVDRYVAVALHGPPGLQSWFHDGVRVEIDDALFQVARFHGSA